MNAEVFARAMIKIAKMDHPPTEGGDIAIAVGEALLVAVEALEACGHCIGGDKAAREALAKIRGET